jgi:hypothetical protein
MHPAGQAASGNANTEWYFLRKVALEIDEDYTMTIVRLELPDITAQAAQAAGLLTPQAIDRLLTEALRKRDAANSLLSIADRVAVAGIPEMSMQEINAEVKAARAQRGSLN